MGPGDPRPLASEATRLGSYEILRKLARGGMAELFLARTHGPEGFEKLVVLKKILPSFAENPKFVRLFLDEARLAATLDHPHIAHVYDMGKVEGNYFFTMEYVHGQDLRSALRRTARLEDKFPIDHTVQIVHAIAAALHYAHERRTPDGKLLDIVHRDVSPSNVLISYDGAIKLVDFGVAKAATSSVKTRTGTLKGKIAYMSPEQAKGSPIDRRSDVFSLGIMLWETLTTSRLFKADNDLATIQLIINSKPQPPSALRPECPPELERIVLKALSADLDARYQTAEELQVDLEEFAREAKLKQSSVGLRSHMQVLFADEYSAWKSAQASGVAIHDHLTYIGANEMTTPVSENELSFMSDGEVEPGDHEEEDDEDSEALEPRQGVVTATTNLNAPAPSAQPSVVVARDVPRSRAHSTGEQARVQSYNAVEEPPTVRFPTGEAPPTVRLRSEQPPTVRLQTGEEQPTQMQPHQMQPEQMHPQMQPHEMQPQQMHPQMQSHEMQPQMQEPQMQPAIARTNSQNFGMQGPNTTPSSGTGLPRASSQAFGPPNTTPSGGMPVGHQPSNAIPQPMGHAPSAPMRAPTIPPGHGPMVIHPPSSQMRMPDAQAAFPIAPREWHNVPSHERELFVQQRIKRWLIGGLCSIAVIVVIILAAAGGTTPPPANAVVDMKPEPVTRQPESSGGTDPKSAPAAPDKPNLSGAGPDTTKPSVGSDKPDTSAGSDSGKSTTPDTSTGSDKAGPDKTKPEPDAPAEPDKTKPNSPTGPDKPTSNGTTRSKPDTKSTPKSDAKDATKTKIKPADKSKHGSAYDPNSALPPP